MRLFIYVVELIDGKSTTEGQSPYLQIIGMRSVVLEIKQVYWHSNGPVERPVITKFLLH